jgi:hypothetical protein
MPVTTRRQSRGLPQPNATDEGEGTSSVNRVSINEGGDDDDPMDGPLAKLSSSEFEDDDEDEHVPSLSEDEDSESSEFGEGTVIMHSCRSVRSVINLYTTTAMPQTPVAKRRKLEKAASPSKVKKSGLSRRVRGRLQNMLSLPLDVLFTVSSRHRLLVLLCSNISSDIVGTAAYGSPEPRAHEQNPAAGVNVAEFNVGLDCRATKRRSHSGP